MGYITVVISNLIMSFNSPQEALSGAVRGVLLKWTALTLSIENHHDRARATAAAETMYAQAVELASRGRDVDEISEMFYSVFDTIDTDIEDGSPEQVASAIIRARDAAAKGDYAPAAALSAPPSNDASRSRSVIKREVEVDAGDDANSGGTSIPIQSQPQRQPRVPAPVDDDGFTTVVRRAR